MSTFNGDMGNDIPFEFGAFDSDGFTFLPSETISGKIWYRDTDGTKHYYDFDDGEWQLSGSVTQLSGTFTADTGSETYYLMWNPNNRADFYNIQIVNSTEGSVAKGKITDTIYISDNKRHR